VSHHGYSLFHLGWRRWWAQNRPRIMTEEVDRGFSDVSREQSSHHYLHVTPETAKAMRQIARLTGRGTTSDPLGDVCTDALRVYEYVLKEEAQQHRAAFLSAEDLDALAQNPTLEGERHCLSPMLMPEVREEARCYFTKRTEES
jgi:hypothetical protein